MLRYVAVLQSFLRRPLHEDKGATAVEYGFMVVLIAAVIVGSITLIGTNLDLLFDGVAPDLVP